jgi:hypothetical protein
MAPPRVRAAFKTGKDFYPRFGMPLTSVPIEQLTFERDKETLP